MTDNMEKAPALGLYLALIWIAILGLPEALLVTGLRGWCVEVADVWRSIGNEDERR